MNLIGISGLAGAGKSTAAKVLVSEFGFVEVSLADPIKRICRDVFQFADEQLWGPSEMRNAPDPRYFVANVDGKPHFLTPRHALQTLGTEWGRDCYGNVWVDIAIRTAESLLEGTYAYDFDAPDGYDAAKECPWIYHRTYGLHRARGFRMKGVVIPDVRFKNEVDAIRTAGGKIWYIDRPGAGLAGAAGAHASENSLGDEFNPDAFIKNAGTLDDFKATICNIARHE